MVDKGEAALNVDLLSKAEIVRAAAGSLNVAQILCQHAVLQAGIRENTQTVMTVETDIRRITTVAVDRIEAKFDKTVEAFAALDGFDSRTCIELLGELAHTEDGVIALQELRTRRRDLRAGIDRLLKQDLIVQAAGIGQHLLRRGGREAVPRRSAADLLPAAAQPGGPRGRGRQEAATPPYAGVRQLQP